MIIANIEHEMLILDNPADAEALLRILSKARKVNSHYGEIDGRFQRYFTDDVGASIGVEFTTAPLVDYAAHRAIVAAAEAARKTGEAGATVTDIKAA